MILSDSDDFGVILMILKWFWWFRSDSDDFGMILMISKWFLWFWNDSRDFEMILVRLSLLTKINFEGISDIIHVILSNNRDFNVFQLNMSS